MSPGIQTPSQDEAFLQRLERWKVHAGGGESFARYCEWEDALKGDGVNSVLGGHELPEDTPLPPWVSVVSEILSEAEIFMGEAAGRASYALEGRLPFHRLLVVFLRVARRKLAERTGGGLGTLSPGARHTLESRLFIRLYSLCGHTLEFEHSVHKALHHDAVTRGLTAPQPVLVERRNIQERRAGTERRVENVAVTVERRRGCDQRESNDRRTVGEHRDLVERDEFAAWLLKGRLLDFFMEYAVLARLIAVMIDQWAKANALLLERIEGDWDALQDAFIGQDARIPFSERAGAVIEIMPELSDPHKGGQAVAILTFRGGIRVVYKPRDLAMEAAWFGFLDWLNARFRTRAKSTAPAFKVLRILNRGTHGWSEHAGRHPCADPGAANRYFQRCGMLLGVVHALRGSDCHKENIIASGEYPVLIDVETLLRRELREDISGGGEIPESPETGGGHDFFRRFWTSVSNTGLLPFWQAEGGEAYEISGFGDPEGSDAVGLGAGTQDGAFLAGDYWQPTLSANTPKLNGRPLGLSDHVEPFLEGFRQVYNLIMAEKTAVCAEDGPLAPFGNVEQRYIFRPSRVYGALLNRLHDPRYLRDGRDFSIELEVLSRALLSSSEKSPFWPLLRAEQESLGRLDTPVFYCHSDSDGIMAEGHGAPDLGTYAGVCGIFYEPACETVRKNILSFDMEDLAFQERLIRASVALGKTRAHAAPGGAAPAGLRHGQEILDGDDMVAEAARIAERLSELRLKAPGNQSVWIGVQRLPHADRYTLQPLGHGMYDGSLGIALFFAALSKMPGRVKYRDTALAAAEPLLKDADTAEKRIMLANRAGIGGGSGVGSMLYALVWLHQFLGEPKLLECASRLSSLITLKRIEQDRQLDVMGGAAGALTGLLALHRVTGDREALDRARDCGMRLVAAQTPCKEGGAAWKTPEGKPLTGFSHGAAGIALALLRLHGATGDEHYLKAAREGIAHERAVYDADCGNWPDFRHEAGPDGKTACGYSWCHGAPGIGLARLAGVQLDGDQETGAEIRNALNTTLRVGLSEPDHLCCGNLGRLEFLHAADLAWEVPVARRQVRAMTSQMVARARANGAYSLGWADNDFSPGLFQGLAGIAYQLLRFARPGQLPSLAAFELPVSGRRGA